VCSPAGRREDWSTPLNEASRFVANHERSREVFNLSHRSRRTVTQPPIGTVRTRRTASKAFAKSLAALSAEESAVRGGLVRSRPHVRPQLAEEQLRLGVVRPFPNQVHTIFHLCLDAVGLTGKAADTLEVTSLPEKTITGRETC